MVGILGCQDVPFLLDPNVAIRHFCGMNRMTIRSKLVWIAVIVALLLLIPYFLITGNLKKLEDKGEKSTMASDLISLVRQVRIAERNYIYDRDLESAEEVQHGIAEIRNIAKRYVDRFEQAENKDAIEGIGTKAKAYQQIFEDCREALEAAKSKQAQLVKEGRELESGVGLVAQGIQRDYQQALGAGVTGAALQAKAGTFSMANEMIRLAAEARIEEKNFILRGDRSHMANVRSTIEELMALATETLARSNDAKKQIETREILANTRAYLAEIQYFAADIDAAKAHERSLEIQALELTKNANEIQLRQAEEEEAIFKTTRLSIPLSIISILIFSTWMLTTVARDVSRRIGHFLERSDQIAKGRIIPEDEEVRSSGKDEMVRATNSLWDINAGFRETTRQAEVIAGGDYDAVISLRSENDILGHTLNRMVENLRSISAENERAAWLREGVNRLSDTMRGDHTHEELSQRIVDMVCPYIKAPVGACYVYDSKEKKYCLSASYAMEKREDMRVSFGVGEGLVGQAAKEKQLISVSEVPEDYMRIRTGMFVVPPKEVIAAPFVVDGNVVGIMELATFQEFTSRAMELLKTVSESIAIAFNSSHAREELHRANQALAEQTQSLEKSEQSLKDQRAELQVANEELQAKTAELEQQKAEIEEKNIELDKARQAVEKQAEELRVASKYKSEFLANMSHELRTPLNSLLILAQSLSDNKGGNLTTRQVEHAEIIHSSGNDLLQLINDILDLSKVEAGQMSINPETIVIQSFCNRVRTLMSPQAERKGLEFIVDVDPDVPAQIISDRQRLEQILRNLVSNAVKFTGKGSVTVSITRCPEDADLSYSGLAYEDALALSVTDTGIGIPADKQALIFEAFKQADGSTSRNYGGTGLGLSISRELSRLLGGEIQLQSEDGVGSTFTVFLPEKGDFENASSPSTLADVATGDKDEDEGAPPPVPPASKPTAAPKATTAQKPLGKPQTASPPQAKASVAKSTPAPSPAKKPQKPPSKTVSPVQLPPAKEALEALRPVGFKKIKDDRDDLTVDSKVILIIEDDPAFARILLELCQDQGLQCVLTPLGREALQFVETFHPMGILLDLNLPDIDGWSVLTQLKENVDHRHIPVHILSADKENFDAYSLGAIGFLSKPAKAEDLKVVFDRIQQVTDQKTKELLIVEDNKRLQEMLVKLMGGEEVVTTAVNTAEAALEKIKTKTYQCIVLDLNLPDKSGKELLEFLTNGVGDDVKLPPIIVYTGQELKPQEEEQLREYAETVIIKGVRSEERLLDEASLFLHRVVADLPEHKRRIIKRMHSKDAFFNGKKVLVVDDDIRNIYALSGLLEESGMEILRASDGQKSLEVLQENPDIDIVLMDIMMPIMDGYEACRRIRKMSKFKKIPIIALTAKAMKEDRQLCLDAGASDYLSKPIDPERLMSIIRAWLY